MTNKEKYQRTFSVLHASDECLEEVKKMNKKYGFYRKRIVAVGAVAIMIFALASVAYAKDVGGIQRNVQIWLYGELTDAVMVIENGEYTMTYTDENGETVKSHGGGVVLGRPFHRTRPMTADELLEIPPHPAVEYREDGSVWFYYMDQKMDITEKFDDDGFCYVTVMEGDHPLYVTIKYQASVHAQTNRYATPKDFEN